jgi:hypothetical protein
MPAPKKFQNTAHDMPISAPGQPFMFATLE